MAEGGLFSWKLQSVRSRGPVADYRHLSRPLPDPPKDMHWIQDLETREWHLVKIVPDERGLINDETIQEATVEEDTSPDFIEHAILPTDTFQGICLQYKVTPTELRRANRIMSGSNNLNLMPNPLRIPMNKKYLQQQEERSTPSASLTPAQKMQRLRHAFPRLATTEAKCYLELNDWNVEQAIENAQEDGFEGR